jgi:hypothetical protein
MKNWLALALFAVVGLAHSGSAQAFCGFYVAKADTDLFNEASQVVMVRDGDRTVLTMSNDFQGDVKDFAMVIPVPTVLEEGQINAGERKVIDHLDAYTAPRLVEYFDPNPCQPPMRLLSKRSRAPSAAAESDMGVRQEEAKSYGVTIEATYTVGEYDILILSAKESNGLEKWLRKEGYKIPKGASQVLKGYIKQDMKFFVAKVNLEEQAKLGFTYLRPIQVAYESPKFMLPIRLGTVNSKGTQELFVYALTKTGRVETTNYRTVRLPSNMDIPTYVKDEFGDFYKAMFSQQVQKENMKAVFLEYAWDMNWCDPCAANPLTADELKSLGVWWVGNGAQRRGFKSAAQNVFVSRLHVRYDGDHFPEDLQFQTTGDRTNFQGRYVLRHAFEGATCDAADAYYQGVHQRQEKEAETLANLTGWKISKIRKKMNLGAAPKGGTKWWEKLWGE